MKATEDRARKRLRALFYEELLTHFPIKSRVNGLLSEVSSADRLVEPLLYKTATAFSYQASDLGILAWPGQARCGCVEFNPRRINSGKSQSVKASDCFRRTFLALPPLGE
uniref:Uncharacterized protein n=1 Tax=Moniliophthora roreri TaxID=221103 RepID=A0A0W0FUN8_MONRR